MRLPKTTARFMLAAQLSVISCHSPVKPSEAVQVTPKSDSSTITLTEPGDLHAKDSIEITAFVRQMYKWKEYNSSWNDFYPKSDNRDYAYIGIDWEAHAKREKQLEATNFFSKEFIKNYTRIAKTIDERLKNGTYTWLAGELPPFWK